MELHSDLTAEARELQSALRELERSVNAFRDRAKQRQMLVGVRARASIPDKRVAPQDAAPAHVNVEAVSASAHGALEVRPGGRPETTRVVRTEEPQPSNETGPIRFWRHPIKALRSWLRQTRGLPQP